MAPNWFEQGKSRHRHERDALEWVQSWLPTHEPWRAFARFAFAAPDGRDYEVDLLVAGPTGCFLIEFKGHEGTISGDFRDLVAAHDGRKLALDHPGRLVKAKIDCLKQLLRSSEAYRSRGESPPFIEPLVFFHHATELRFEEPNAAAGVVLRDLDGHDPARGPGLRAAILERRAPWLRHQSEIQRFDKPAAKRLTSAIQKLGYFGQREEIVAGSWKLDSVPLEVASMWSDHGATHALTKERRTVRVYVASGDQGGDRAQLANAAKLEYEALRTFDHPGILRAHDLAECRSGHAIVFDDSSSMVRLDHFLRTEGHRLDFLGRIGLVRQLCEAITAAHDRGIAHRALIPSAILVETPRSERPVLKIRNWHWRVRTDAAERPSIQTFGGETVSNLSRFAEELPESERTYLAPELRSLGETGGISSDIFSLGCLSFLIFSGRPPANTLDELDETLRRHGALAISQQVNGASAGLEHFLARSAHATPLQRATTARELILALDQMQSELESPELPELNGPEDLVKGVGVGDGLVVERRLGAGGTAFGFEVRKDDRSLVLKVARSADFNGRMDKEAAAIERLAHPHVVSLEGRLSVGACQGLLLSPFGSETLHDYLKREGALQFEFLERWGTQLLEAVEHLESVGVAHRDIKPGNVAVTDRGQRRQMQVVLFDFSLAGLEADNLNAGTPGYIDPFLGTGNRRQWDRAAERYALAVTLYEMATGTRPVWGDGGTLPTLLRDVDRPNLDADLLPEEARASLLTFFERALHKDIARRFDSATAMREAWKRCLEGSALTIHTRTNAWDDDPSTISLADAIAASGLETIVTALPLTARAMNALGRLGVDSIQDLLRRTPHALRWLRGVGGRTQRELSELYQLCHSRFPDVEVTIRSLQDSKSEAEQRRTGQRVRKPSARRGISSLPAEAPLEEIARLLTVTSRNEESRSMEALADYLGLGPVAPGEASAVELGSAVQAAAAHGLTRAAINITLNTSTTRWGRSPAFERARGVAAELVLDRGGVLSLAELGQGLATRLPSDGVASAADRAKAAAGLALAVVEAEHRQDSPRFDLRRLGDRIWVHGADLTAAASYAVALGKRADELVAHESSVLPSPASCIAALREVPRPPVLAELSSERLLALAAAGSRLARTNGRGELYPAGLSAVRALKLSQGALAGLGGTDPETRRRSFSLTDLRERVAHRYPEAQPLPGPAECLPILREFLGPDVEYDEARERFLVRAPEMMTVQGPTSSHATLIPTQYHSPGDSSISASQRRELEFLDAVRIGLKAGRTVVLAVQPRWLEKAAPKIAEKFQLRTVSVDNLILDGVRKVAAQRSIQIERIHDADRAWPQGAASGRLRQVLDAVRTEELEPSLLRSQTPELLRDFGLLFHYQMQSVYQSVRDACGARQRAPLVCLVPSDDAEQSVTLDGYQFPEFDTSRIVRVPSHWLAGDVA